MMNENVEAHILGHRLYLVRGADDKTDFYAMQHYTFNDSGPLK